MARKIPPAFLANAKKKKKAAAKKAPAKKVPPKSPTGAKAAKNLPPWMQ
jgi:hypothetical protein